MKHRTRSAPEQPDSLLHPDRPSLLPHPLMLEISDIHGNLKPAFQEYEEMLPLEPGSLNPAWWPHQGKALSVRERHGDFNSHLDETYRHERQSPGAFPPPPANATASATPPSSRPQLVLKSLLLLRSAVLRADSPTQD